jgi:hypothetical protein
MLKLIDIAGAFVELAGRFVDESLAFSLGWNYWYLWVTNIAGKFTLTPQSDPTADQSAQAISITVRFVYPLCGFCERC